MEQEIAADTVDLVRVFRDVLERLRERPVLDVDEDSGDRGADDRLREAPHDDGGPAGEPSASAAQTHSERALICMFLAMLELVRLQAVLLHQPLRARRHSDQEGGWVDQVFADQAQARDDWR